VGPSRPNCDGGGAVLSETGDDVFGLLREESRQGAGRGELLINPEGAMFLNTFGI